MKRKLLIFTLLFLLLPFLKVHSASMDSYIDWNLDRGVFAHQYRDGQDHITNLAMITANGKVAYCIEPGVVADKGSMYNSTYDINETNLKGVDVKKLSLIGYYGYGYKGHDSKEYYMAAQELIWRHMGVSDVWWTDSKYGGNVINIESYKNEILKLVNSYEISPKFNFDESYVVGEEIIIKDVNNVINEYGVEKGNVSIVNDSIKINVKEKDNDFVLKRKANGKSAIFYYKSGYQTIGSFEYAYDFSASYDINSRYGKIIIKKLDFDNKSIKPASPYASIKGATYTLYDSSGNIVDVKQTNEDGTLTFEKLKVGKYVVKETKASLGYNLDMEQHDVLVSSKEPEVIINSFEKIIKNEIRIVKVLDKDGNKLPEEGIKFGLYYEDGTLIDTYITDKNGEIKLVLPYGNYVLKQLSTKEGIDVAPDKKIKIIKEGQLQNITITNHELKKETVDELPDTGKEINFSYFLVILSSFGSIFYYYEKENN